MRHLLRRGGESTSHYLMRQARYVRGQRQFVRISVVALLVLLACIGWLAVISLE